MNKSQLIHTFKNKTTIKMWEVGVRRAGESKGGKTGTTVIEQEHKNLQQNNKKKCVSFSYWIKSQLNMPLSVKRNLHFLTVPLHN